MAITKQINIIPDDSWQRVHVSQGDIGRTLQFVLYEGSTSYTIPVGATVKIQGTKPSGLGFSETCTWSGSTVTIDTTEAMTQEFGGIPTEIRITDGDDVLGTTNFLLIVERNPHPDNTTDGTQDTIASLEVRIEALESAISGGGLTNDIKQALLDCFEHVAWINADGQDYYDALEDALYPPANLVSISCVYTQSGTVYDTDTLDSLKSDLVVTAHYDDNTTATVTSYTLSGTLTVGTSTITVSYGEKTTTFTVAVTEAPTVSSISAVYTQSGIVSPSDTLDSLKSDLVVTATWSDSTTTTVSSSDYTLSGTLTVGTSTITVAYSGKTTTFTVIVSESGLLYSLASLTTTTTDGSEEIATGVNPLNYTDISIALTIDEVTDWTWVAYAIFSSGLTGIGNVFALQSSGNGNIDFKIGQTGMTISTDLIAKYNTSLANAPLVFTISNVNTQRPTVNAYGYVSGDVVTKSWEITANRDITTAQNIYIAPATSHAYNIAKSFKGTLSNFKIYSRILTTDEINSYLAGA